MPATDERTLTELEQVEGWREHVLFDAGYPADDAIALARRSDIDLHQACWLLTNGCPLETALKILT
ncbi:MAG TPA: hypothetical protein VIL92_06175 [Gaiellaceae bacterium]|jgi:hypothetical protein